jgi:hypothetical protein
VGRAAGVAAHRSKADDPTNPQSTRYPHHVTQRGFKKAQVFFSDEDYREYLSILREEIRAKMHDVRPDEKC